MNDSPATAPYLATLNEAQRAAVEALDGPVLVLAGAGTGKTRVLTTRLAHILLTGRAMPGELLAVTFTNKAARGMKERVAALLERPVEGWWLGTFHALAARILRRHAELVGLRPNFTILDADDQLRLVKQITQAAGIDDKRWPVRGIHAAIERWKDRGLGPDQIAAGEASELAGGRLIEIYRDYQQRLRTVNACDFGDLLLHNLTILQNHADVAAAYQRQFKYILVDEYQDANVAQYLWLRLLAQGRRNLCCVGDDDQSIYGWRGAEVGNILRFEADFPGARVVRLERNYRSTRHILAAAAGLIAHNQGRLGKTLWTEGEVGDKVAVWGFWGGDEEARAVADEIEALQRRGTALGQIAILVRAGFQTREFEERFLALAIPYRVVGGPRFYERQEIRDAVAYLRLVHQPDDDLAFERIVNTPRRGIGGQSVQTLHLAARGQGISLMEATRRLLGTDELRSAGRRALKGFIEDIDRWRGFAATHGHCELAQAILDESGYTAMWQAEKTPDAAGRLDNLKELIAAMAEFETLAGFLEHISLVMEAAEGPPGEMVNLMTLHAAKGLEFDAVFLPGWEEGLLPHQRALDEGGATALEEERRLAHVGLTRARRRAYVSFVANRRMYNLWQSAVPSRFVEELPREHVEVQVDLGLHGGHGGGLAEKNDPWPAPRPTFPGARRRGVLVEATATVVDEGPGAYAVGSRIFHDKFGYGSVIAVEGAKLDIAFDKAGAKKVMASFVVPAERAG